jgi:hypothetical protein
VVLYESKELCDQYLDGGFRSSKPFKQNDGLEGRYMTAQGTSQNKPNLYQLRQ